MIRSHDQVSSPAIARLPGANELFFIVRQVKTYSLCPIAQMILLLCCNIKFTLNVSISIANTASKITTKIS